MGPISEREADVLAALGARLTNAQIAHRLHISVRTVESHVSALLRKYGVADRSALAELGRQIRPGGPDPGRLAGLPAGRTSFVGRDEDRASVLAALDGGRLVTLLGPGGVGKTRLAVEVAEAAGPAFPSGGAFVDLVPVRDGFVARAVATVLGVTEGSHQPLAEAVAAHLGDGRSLLVLDNCEHVIDEAAGLAEQILAACPGTRILVTSRERLGVPGERTVPVEPLVVPDAERLFHDRALAADPGFVADAAVVAELCARLDGVPLAIELAAARSASLGGSGLLAALEDALRLLSGRRGGDERHRSLRGVIGWSHDLLDEEEQRLFRRLGVFVGAFDLAAAIEITGERADVLGRLVDKSLVVHLRGTPSRWRLLEVVRAYAVERLELAGEQEETRARHLRWAAATATALEDRLDGAWRDDFDATVADLRAALAAAPPGPDPTAHRLARALAHLTYARRHLMESLGHYRLAATHATTPADAARDLRAAAGCAHVGTMSTQQVFDLLVAAASQAGDGRAIDLARAVETACRYHVPAPRERLVALFGEAERVGDRTDLSVAASLAIAAAWMAGPGDAPDARLARAALEVAEPTGDPAAVSAALCAVGTAALHAGRPREAHRVTQQRLSALALMDRDDPYYAPEICNTYGRACLYAITAGDLPGARSAALAGLNDDLMSQSYVTVSRLVPPLVLTGRLHEGLEHAARMWEEWERAGRPNPSWMAPAVAMTALAYGLLGDHGSLALWRARTAQVAGAARPAVALFADVRLAIHTSQPVPADPAVVPGDPYTAYAQAAAAELAVVSGLPDAAERLSSAARAAEQNEWAAACLARATGRLHADTGALTASIEAWERLDARAERACTLLLLPDRADEAHTELEALGIPLP
ncbi:ATP-binding protein [Nonomuraea sp. NPDC050536]|uniref:ATP-binding protein n=1 Tax=Nonomuraea sp. NPDC050536 TaxID=3364366 RepID=UPI0037C63027